MQCLVFLNLEQTGVTDAGVIQYLQTRPANLLHLILNRTCITQAIFPHIQECANQLKSLSLEDTKVCIQWINRVNFLVVLIFGMIYIKYLIVTNLVRSSNQNRLYKTKTYICFRIQQHLESLQLHPFILFFLQCQWETTMISMFSKPLY